jgi:UPF0755 protein
MIRRALYIFAALAAALAFLIGAVLVPPRRLAHPQIVSIASRESFRDAARDLAHAGIVRSSLALMVYGRWTGMAEHIKPGDYSFSGGESMDKVLRHLVNGDFMTITVTIPEGLTVHQIGERLQQAGLVCDGQFDAAAFDGPLVQSLGLGPLGAEGFLFPATYRFSPFARSNQIVAAMLERFSSILTPTVEERMFALGLDQRKLVTLASIIEKEAKVAGERPLIASVFYNRLARGMPLQSDPTAQYNLTGETERAFDAVHAASAFNTYVIAGLPPGPIANPGLSSIQAALYPADTDYLYFVARDNGTHVFSRSYKEHQRAIAELRRMHK